MKDFIKLLFRLVPPYKTKVFLNVINNLLSTLFSLFSFAMIIPILEMLFKSKPMENLQLMALTSDMGNWGTALKNNFYYFIETIIKNYGGGTTLMILGAFLILMTTGENRS